MAAYAYVLWAIEDNLTKIGISTKVQKRLSTHSGNSSNPLKFVQWKLYQFSDVADARKVEQIARERLLKRGMSYRGKKELFNCSPVLATDAIDEACNVAGIIALRNFPFDTAQILERFSDFPSLPDFALEVLTAEQRRLYWKGAQDALFCELSEWD